MFCLGAVVNSVTHNYQLVKETFMKFFGTFLIVVCIQIHIAHETIQVHKVYK